MIHLGAISDTTATDGDAVMDNNFRLSLKLLDWCTATRTPFIYASSAATYGDGDQGFSDEWSTAALKRFKPMNLYGWSKHLFDLALAERVARKEKLPPQWAGCKFFNVFGPNEYHKGAMMSLVAKKFDDAKAGKPIRLFKSHRDGIADGEQKPRFHLCGRCRGGGALDARNPAGDRHFQRRHRQGAQLQGPDHRDVRRDGRASRTSNMSTCRTKSASQYQYFTQAEVANLQRAGYNAGFTPLEDAVRRYVTQFLDREDRYR